MVLKRADPDLTTPTVPAPRQVNVELWYDHGDDAEPLELGDVPVPAKGDVVEIGMFRNFLVTGVMYRYSLDTPGWCRVTVWTVETTSQAPPEVFDEDLQEWRVMTTEEMDEPGRMVPDPGDPGHDEPPASG